MENLENRNSESQFIEFFKRLDENYQRYLINEIQKKPPDADRHTKKADSAGMVGDPESR